MSSVREILNDKTRKFEEVETERNALQAALDDLVMTREYGTLRYGPGVSPLECIQRYHAEWDRAYALSKALKDARTAQSLTSVDHP